MVSNSYNNLSPLGRSNPDPRAEKLQGIIDRGRVRVPQVLREIEEEFHKREDVVVKPGALGFRVVDGEIADRRYAFPRDEDRLRRALRLPPGLE